MKKRLFLSIPLLCLLALPISLAKEATQADASTQTHLVVDDNFNNSTYSGGIDTSKWIDYSNNSLGQSTTGETYMYNHQSYAGVEHVDFSTKFELFNLEYFQFDYKYDDDSADSNRWFSVFFLDDPESLVADKATSDYLAYKGCGLFTQTSIQPAGTSDFTAVVLGDVTGATAKDNWITIRIAITDDTHGVFHAAKRGEDFSGTGSTFTYNRNHCTLRNPYVMIGLSHDVGGIMFDNIVASYSGGQLISENFDDFDIEVNPNFKFNLFNNASMDSISIDFVCNSKFEFKNGKVNDYVETKNYIEDDGKNVTDVNLFEAQFDLFIDTNDEVSLVFGLAENQTDLYKGTVVYQMSASKGILKEFDDSGAQTTEDKSNTNTFGKVKSVGSTLKITYTRGDGINIYENGTKVKNSGSKVTFAKVENVFGRVAIVYSAKGNGGSTVDNIRVFSTYYYIPTTKSVTHNFSNDFFGNEGYKDFYVNNPSGAGAQTVKDGKLVWAMASDNTFFGSAHQYDNFILDFKLCSIKADITVTDSKEITAVNKWIGLDLSRPTVDYFQYGSYLTHITMITQPQEATVAGVSMWSQRDSGVDPNAVKMKNFEKVDPDLFRAIQYRDDASKSQVREEDAVCFRYVSNNGTLSFYLKKACEKNFTKYWEYYDLELNGYFTLCCTGWTYLELDDFSMSNTSDVYTCANNEAPEKVTEIVTKTVYDNQNGEIDFKEEIKINTKGGCGSSLIASSAIATVIGLVGVIGLFIRKKK